MTQSNATNYNSGIILATNQQQLLVGSSRIIAFFGRASQPKPSFPSGASQSILRNMTVYAMYMIDQEAGLLGNVEAKT